MKYLALFGREKNYKEIMLSIYRAFGIDQPYQQNVLSLENPYQIIKISMLTTEMGEKEEKIIREQKNAVFGFFSQIQNCNEDIKINLIHHILQSCLFVFVEIALTEEGEKDLSEEDNFNSIQQMIQQAMYSYDNILITNDGCTALNPDGQVILSEDGYSDLEFYFPFLYEDNPKFLKKCTSRQITRRNKNMKFLFERKIYVCELPVNDDDKKIKLRTKTEIAERIFGLLAISLYSESLLNPAEQMEVTEARNFVSNVLADNYGIKDLKQVLTPEEIEYFQNDASEESERINYSWCYEHLYLLEWAFGLAEWNYPDNICDVPFTVRVLKSFHSVEELCEKTVLRSKKEILDMADLVYRMDWAAVDARIHRMTGPAGLNHGVVQARHKTLNWLIGFDNEEWDEVSTPT